MEFIIKEGDRDAIVAYLLTRPMSDVEGGVQVLRSLPEYIQPEEVKPSDKTK